MAVIMPKGIQASQPQAPGERAHPGARLVSRAPPRRADSMLERPRLDRPVFDSAAKLVVVRAPAGFGKTTLMQQWRRQLETAGVAHAWLTLSERDNDPVHLVAALNTAVSQATGMRNRELSHEPPGFLDRLTSLGRRFVLLLDEAEALSSSAAAGVIESALRRTPATVQIILAGRAIPRVGQARLRLDDTLVSLDARALQFSAEETAAFFTGRLQGALTRAQIENLHQYTGGWAAALQLAHLTIRDSGAHDPSHHVSLNFERDLADYLDQYVLTDESHGVRQFLLDTAILTRLNGSLCNALTGRDDGEAMLLDLQAKGLFLKPLSAEDGLAWYSYHPLFANVLIQKAEASDPARMAGLHQAAAGWFDARGLAVEAAEHARRAGEDERALSLLDSVAIEQIWRGRLRTVLQWGADLGVEVAARYEHLFCAHLWAEGFIGDRRRAFHQLDALARRMENAASISPYLSDTLVALPLVLATAEGDWPRLRRDGPAALERVTDPLSFEYAALACCVGYAYLTTGEIERARRTLYASKRASHVVQRSYNLSYTKFIEASLHLCELDTERALSALRFGYDNASAEFGETSQSSAIAASLYAEVLYQRGDLDGARALLGLHLPMIAETIPECIATAYGAAIAIEIASGETEHARAILAEGEVHAQSHAADIIVRVLGWHRAWLCVLGGDRLRALRLRDELARQEAELDDEIFSMVDAQTRDLYRLRIDVALGRPDLAHDLVLEIDRLLLDARRRTYGHRVLRLEILKALALELQGESVSAEVQMAHALALGVPNGYVQPFLDEGVRSADLAWRSRQSMDALMSGGPWSGFDAALAKRLGHVPAPDAPGAGAPRLDPSEIYGELTDREADILAIMEKGMTNREIGQILEISENTVKWHLRNIFDKLGVGNRTEALFTVRTSSALET